MASSKPNCWCIWHSIYNRWEMQSTLGGSGKPAPGSLQGNGKTETRGWFFNSHGYKKLTQFFEHRSIHTYAYFLPRTHVHARTPWHTYMNTRTIYFLQGLAQNSLWESAASYFKVEAKLKYDEVIAWPTALISLLPNRTWRKEFRERKGKIKWNIKR